MQKYFLSPSKILLLIGVFLLVQISYQSITQAKPNNPTNQQPRKTQWRNQLLQGITSIPKLGYPGQSIVYGENSTVILVGDKINDILISAAQLGNGRIVLITHDAYLNDFKDGNSSDKNIKKLHQNIQNWITKGKYNPSKLLQAGSFVKAKDQSSYTALYSAQTTFNNTEAQKNKIMKFVKNGGGLVVAICPWGWSQIHNSLDFTQMLAYNTVIQSGMALTQQVIWESNTFDPKKANVYLSQLDVQIKLTLAKPKTSIVYTDTFKIVKSAKYLPQSQKQKISKIVSPLISKEQITKIAPSTQNPTKDYYNKSKISLYQQIILSQGIAGVIAPGYQTFPGQINKKMSVYKILNQVALTLTAPGYSQHHLTGYYAVAGQTVKIEVVGTFPSSNWEVTIGYHYDDDSDQEQWVRWPTVYTYKLINSKIIYITSPFGGLIVFRSPDKSNQTIRVKISNVLEAPFLDSTDSRSVSDWQRRKYTAGAWGCIKGQYVGFCMPRASFQNIKTPLWFLVWYDYIYQQYHILRGTNPNNQRKRYVIADISPSVGYMHSGYPIVTMLDVATPDSPLFLFNYQTLITQGQWGLFHQLGHNMQREWWTFEGTGEVSNNIFSLKATELTTGKTPKNSPWLINQKKGALQYLKSPNFTKWKQNPGIALMIYAQVIQQFGWRVFEKVFSYYEKLDPQTIPQGNQQRMDFFWGRVSIQAGSNLSPLLQKWGIPYTDEFTNQVKNLPAYKEKVNLFK